MSKTPALKLNTYPPNEWATTKYMDFIKGLAGDEPDSNMRIIDQAISDLTSKKADLVDGLVPAAQLPSYVDDVIEGTISEDLSSFTVTGDDSPCVPEAGKIYIDITHNITYRWGGSVYAPVGSDLALGETSTTAYRGDRGKLAYDHISLKSNPHGVTKDQVGLGSVDNTSDMDKPVSTAQQIEFDAINAKIGAIASSLDQINGEVI